MSINELNKSTLYAFGISLSWHIEAETKWPPFYRWHFKVHFLEWKPLNFKDDYTETCSLWPNRKYGSIGSDNCLAPNRQQAIIRSNADMLYWHIYASLGLNDLNKYAAFNCPFSYAFHRSCGQIIEIHSRHRVCRIDAQKLCMSSS